MRLDAGARAILLMAARRSIERRLAGENFSFDSSIPFQELQTPRSSFVTLRRHGTLRGCIGSLEPQRPLLDDVIHNAKAAAFSDPRFPPLTAPELINLHIEISVLSTIEPIKAHNRSELLRTLVAEKDGLIVQDVGRRATFLPSTWRILPDPDLFYDELMKKAGLNVNHWSATLRFFRYYTETFEQE